MKKSGALVAFILLYSIAFSQDEFLIGKKFTLTSNILQENRTCWVYLPPDYNNSKYALAKYPVIYLLDGESNFHSFTGIMQHLSKGPYASIPQMIVVGIMNTDRTRDLTPTAAGRAAYYDKEKALFKNSGGSGNFIGFLQKELRPYLDSAYRTSGYNILHGHSFGGLTATNILLNNTKLFNAYIIIDPSLWWDNTLLLKQADSLFSKKDFEKRNMYVALAHKEIVPQDTTTDHPRSIQQFYHLLSSKHPKGLRWNYHYYEQEDHGTIVIPASFDALKFIFKGHQVHVKQAVTDTTLVSNHFKALSEQLGFPFKPTASYLDWLSNYCKSIGNKETAAVYERMAGSKE